MPLENAYAGAQGARYELRPEDLLDADREARSRKTGPDRHLSIRIPTATPTFRNRSEELLSVVFVCRAIDQKGEFDHANSLLPERRTDRRGERRTSIWPKS